MAAGSFTRIFLIDIEASDLCPREHELGTSGSVVVQALVDGVAYGSSGSQRSFPRPRWPSLAVQGPNFHPGTSELTIRLVDADPLQPRVGEPFCFGSVRLKEALAPLAYQQRLSFPSQGLEGAPGRYGALSFQVCTVGPNHPNNPNHRRLEHVEPEERQGDPGHLAHPLDWCGVLRFTPELRDVPRGHRGLWSMEAAAGPPDGRGSLSPSSSFVSWQVQEEEGKEGRWRQWLHWRHEQLFVVERDLLFSVRAACPETGWEGSCLQRLSKMRGPRGPCNMFTEAHPDPLLLKMHGTDASVAVHLRFFPAEFLKPSSRAGGISIRITLAAAPPTLPLPLVFNVPSGCFSMTGDRAKDTPFHISRVGDCTEVCLPDPFRLLGRSVWKVATTLDGLQPCLDCLVDVLALRLRPGDEKVVTLPVGDHAIVLRLCLTKLHVDVARPVLGVCVPTKEPMEVIGGQPEHGQVIGVFVHALAVHSPQVTCCLLSGGPEASTLFYPLPHLGGKVFVPTQPDGHGKVTIIAYLPEFGCHAATQTAIGDGCLQLHWRFSDGQATVLGAALVTFARWPAEGCLSAARIRLRILRTRIPEQALPHFVPLTLTTAGGTFEWSGEDGGTHDAVLSVAGPFGEPGELEVRSGHAMATALSMPELMSAQAAQGFTCRLKDGEVQAADNTKEPQPKRKKKLAFDDVQGTRVDASDSEDSESGSGSEHDAGDVHDEPARSQQQWVPKTEAGASQSTLSLPVLVEKERHGSCAFFFLPVRMQQVLEGPVQSSEATFRRLSKGTGGSESPPNGGVILLQQVSAIANLGDAHGNSHARCEGVWEPVPAISLTASGNPGVAGRATCQVASPKTGQGIAASWSPVSALCRRSPPDILRAKFAVKPSEELGLDIQLELRFCCSACNRAVTLTARGQVHMSTLWRPFDVRLSFDSSSGLPAAGCRGAAFARIILCPSALCNPTAGLLTLEVLPQYPGGPGVAELLDSQSEEQYDHAVHALHDQPAGLRLLLDTDGSPALMLDGRLQDPANGRQQLCVEVSSQDALQNVLLEIQALSGARRGLVSVCLAALGPLGDVPVLAYHLHLGSRGSLALVASFEPRRHQVELRDAQALKPSVPLVVESKTFTKATEKEEKSQRLAEGLRQLPRPRPFVPRSPARPFRAEQGSARRSASAERVPAHPFLERGLHHWVTPLNPLAVKKPGQMWTQEMGRKRPASAKVTGRNKQDGARKPPGWDHASEAKDGPKYRRDFLARQREKVWQLREQLSRCQVEKERQDQRLGHVRKAFMAAQQELNAKNQHERKPGVRHSRSKDARIKADHSTLLGPGRGAVEQVCVRCGTLVPERSRYCAGCLPSTQREALDLRKSVGKSLATQAALERKLELQHEERAQLEAKHADLEAQLYAAETGRPDSESEAAQQLLAMLAQLKTLQLDSEAQSRLDAERLQALQHREEVITAAHEEAEARCRKATSAHQNLQKQLEAGRKKVDTLLGKLGSAST